MSTSLTECSVCGTTALLTRADGSFDCRACGFSSRSSGGQLREIDCARCGASVMVDSGGCAVCVRCDWSRHTHPVTTAQGATR